jgi:hypothetical protein
MSEQESFQEWVTQHHREWYLRGDRFEMLEKAWQACAEGKDKIIEQQAAELQALREYAKETLSPYIFGDINKNIAKKCGLIDENGAPTALLTGVKVALGGLE